MYLMTRSMRWRPRRTHAITDSCGSSLPRPLHRRRKYRCKILYDRLQKLLHGNQVLLELEFVALIDADAWFEVLVGYE